jgi:uncharacterized coiled-coil protein SlyX
MGDFMASRDVSDRLEGIETRINQQDLMLVEVNKSLSELVRIGERQISLTEKMDDMRDDMKDMDKRITANHDQITRWLGLGSGVVAIMGMAAAAISIYTSIK